MLPFSSPPFFLCLFLLSYLSIPASSSPKAKDSVLWNREREHRSRIMAAEVEPHPNPTGNTSPSPDASSGNVEIEKEVQSGGKRELKEHECYDKLAYCWPTWKKWAYLSAVAFVQVSMNFNTSVFPNAVKPLSSAFQIGQQEARTAQMIYLVTYSVGCELWAPWSEEFGRWPILQLSMFLINIWQIPCGVAPNWGTIVVCRGLVSCS